MKTEPQHSKETLSTLYDTFYAQADRVLKQFNPCNIRATEDGVVLCSRGDVKWCCEGCKHLTPTGCGVEALSCKLWLCDAARYKAGNGQAVITLDTLRWAGRAIGLHTGAYGRGFRASKAEHGL